MATTELWVIGAKLALLAGVVLQYTLAGAAPGVTTVLLVLAHVSAAAVAAIARRRAGRVAAVAVSVAVAAAGAAVVEPAFSLLIPLPAAELVWELTGRMAWVPAPAAALALTLRPDHLVLYVPTAALSVGVFALVTWYDRRLDGARREADRLRMANETWRKRADRTEVYEEELTRLAQMEERNRLARAVHDHVGHAISGSLLQIEAAASLLPADAREARGMLENGARALREGMDSLRATLRATLPPPEQIGIHRIRAMVDRAAAEGRLATRLTHSGDLGAIDRGQWRVIEDNLRESITNALRHSGGSELSVTITVLNRIVRVEARDDGRGGGTIRKGLGISGMEERTERAGGKVIVDGSHGFSVVTVLPRGSDGEGA